MFDDNDDFFGFEKTPIYKKAIDVWEVAHRIAEMASDMGDESKTERESRNLEHLADIIAEDAYMIAPKIASAWSSDFYDIKMENATIIRYSAMNVLLHLRSLEVHGFKEVEYCELLRKEIEEFRLLFIEWVKTFDPWNYKIDRWGLFNPPGVSHDDIDPNEDEDEIDFDDFDFLGEEFDDEDDDDFDFPESDDFDD